MKVLEKKKQVITSLYGKRTFKVNGKTVKDFHTGIDLGPDDNIVACEKGKVTKVVRNVKGFAKNSYGNYVVLEHYGISTRYAHLEYYSIPVKVGDIVPKGAVIGNMGQTGTSYGTHLHFETIIKGKTVDPYDYLYNIKKILPYGYKKPTIIQVGDTVKVTGKYWANTKTPVKIPLWAKLKKYKVIQAEKEKVLLGKIMSWVLRKDVKKV